MSEMALTASHLIVIGRGRLIADVGVEELTRMASHNRVRVRTTEAARLRQLLAGDGVVVTATNADTLEVTGLDSTHIGLVAARVGIPLIELIPLQASLEEAFMNITRDTVEFATAGGHLGERIGAEGVLR
jgi:ABC-2 type transport system ATP-binding protein